MLRPVTDLSTSEARARDRHRRLALSALASAAARVFTIAAGLISVPLTLHYLGPERYGIWIVISSFTAMLSFADMGLGNGIINSIAFEHGRDNRAGIRQVLSSGYMALLAIAAIILAAFACAYPFLPWYRIFNVTTPQARSEAGPALAVFIVCFALTIPLSLVQKVQIALQQSFIASLWQCLGSLLTLIGLLLVIHWEGGLAFLVLALVGTPLVTALLNSVAFFYKVGHDIRPSFASVSRDAIGVAARTGLMFFILQIVVSLAYGSDTVIIAQIAGPQAVAQYAVPDRMFGIISMIVGMMLAPLWPAYGEALSRGDHHWVKKTLRRTVVIAAAASALISAVLVVLGPWLIHLWVGDAVRSSLLLLIGLGAWRVIETSGNAVAMYMNGTNALRFQIVIAVMTGIAAIALKIFLVHRIGAAGIPWGSTVSYLLFAALPTFLFVRRRLAA